MIESAPLFIEYCCETYIHHDTLNIAVMAAFFLAALIVMFSWWWMVARTYKFAQKADAEIVRLRAELEHAKSK